MADVVENPKNITFESIDLLNLAKAYDEKTSLWFAAPNLLEPAGLTTKDAILLEDEEASKHYAYKL